MKSKPTYEELEKKLQYSEEKNEIINSVKETYNIIERSPVVVFLWKNIENWPVEFVSKNVKDIFGYSAKDFINSKVVYAGIIYPADLQRVSDEVSEAGKSNIVSFKHKPYRIVNKLGEIKWIEDITYIRRNEKGEIIYYEGVILDITDRKGGEQSLMDNKILQDKILNTFYNSVYLSSSDYEIQYLNPAMIKKIGYNAVGEKCYKAIYNRNKVCEDCYFNNLKENNKKLSIEKVSTDKFYLIESILLENNAKLTVYHDITEKKQSVLFKQKNEELSILNKKYREQNDKLEKAQKDLKASEERYKEAQKLAHLGNWEQDFINKKLFWSEEVYRIFGLQPSELEPIYEVFLNCVHPDDRAFVNYALTISLKNKSTFNLAYRLLLESGELKYVDQICRTEYDYKGNIVKSTGTILDITEREKNAKVKDILLTINQESAKADDVEQLAPKIQNELNKIFNTENFYIALYDKKTETYSFPYHNDKYDKEYDYKNKSYKIEKSLTDYVREGKKAKLINSEIKKELFKKGLIEEYGKHSQVWIGAPLINSKKFSYGVIAIQSYDNAKAYNYDDLSILNYVAKNISKLIEKKQAENYLKKSEEKYRMLYETANDALLIMNNEIFIDCNKKALEMFACTKDQIIGVAPYEFSPEFQPDGRKSKEKALEKINDAVKGNHKTFEWVHTKYDGTVFCAEISLNTFELNNINVIQTIVRDVSERKKFEKALKQKNEELKAAEEELRSSNDELHWANVELEKNIREIFLAKEKAGESSNLKSAFLTNISHEIRTPMNGINGFTELIDSNNLNEKTRKLYIEIIKQSSKQLLSIIDDVLDISKIETGQMVIRNKAVDINKMLSDLYESFVSNAKTKNINLIFKNALSEKQCLIFSDETKTKQILSNLINNALKFTQIGFVEFGYIIKSNFLEFYVKDSGIGISPDNHAKIFDRFRQLELTYSRKYGGTGLGLSISKELVEMLGGKIWLNSELNNGSTFHFTIPYKTVKEGNLIKEQDLITKFPDWSKFTILIAEDEKMNLFYLQEVLNATNVNLLHAVNGKEAVDLCEAKDNIDLVLMDIKMPKMNGFEATKLIKQMKPKMPIIVQSAYAMVKDKNRALQFGCDDYISKPINHSELIRIIGENIDKGYNQNRSIF
ncbi:MAG: PAS domain-containing protein [Bacteroidales bacterium]|nr:PAS domain-containing protein [Bacteroidales bacterium]